MTTAAPTVPQLRDFDVASPFFASATDLDVIAARTFDVCTNDDFPPFYTGDNTPTGIGRGEDVTGWIGLKDADIQGRAAILEGKIALDPCLSAVSVVATISGTGALRAVTVAVSAVATLADGSAQPVAFQFPLAQFAADLAAGTATAAKFAATGGA